MDRTGAEGTREGAEEPRPREAPGLPISIHTVRVFAVPAVPQGTGPTVGDGGTEERAELLRRYPKEFVVGVENVNPPMRTGCATRKVPEALPRGSFGLGRRRPPPSCSQCFHHAHLGVRATDGDRAIGGAIIQHYKSVAELRGVIQRPLEVTVRSGFVARQ